MFCESVATDSIEFAHQTIRQKVQKTRKRAGYLSLGNRLLLFALLATHWSKRTRYKMSVACSCDAKALRTRISPRRSLARDRSKHPGRARESQRQVGSVGLHQCTGHQMPAQTSRPAYRGSTSHLRRNP